MLRKTLFGAFAVAVVPLAALSAQPPEPSHPTQGRGVTIVLENGFIEKYMDRSTIETEFEPLGKSAVHKAKDDGEVHIGGIAREAKLATVAEVMNAGGKGKKAMGVFADAINGGKKVKAV